MPVAPPRPKDLPLNALRAFESAARLGSFVAAGQELGVSPGAVTAHVKTLEDALGIKLFHREAKGVRLTRVGEKVLQPFTEAFDALGLASQILKAEAGVRTVHIATLPSIAQLWLSPRLPHLREMAPDISVSITALETPPNLKRAPYDLCLFYDDGRGGQIVRDVIFPVCTPALAEQVKTVEDLNNVPCLVDATWARDWEIWLKEAAPDAAIKPVGPTYSLYALAVEECVNGAGVLIGHEALVSRHLAAGTLVAPFDRKVTLPRFLRVWTTHPHCAGGAYDRVTKWLQQQ